MIGNRPSKKPEDAKVNEEKKIIKRTTCLYYSHYKSKINLRIYGTKNNIMLSFRK